MASISTSIELHDRVSRPVMSMISALGNMVDAFEAVERSMDGSFDSSKIQQARRATEQAALEVVQLGNNLEQAENHQQQYNRSVQGGSSAMDGLLGKVGTLVATYASVQTLMKAVNLSDTFTQTKARIDLMNQSFNKMNGTAMETDDLVKMIYHSSQNARGSFDEMASVIARFGNNAKDAFSNQEEVVAFANLIQKQMTIAGASTAEASAALIQLSQGLGSGVLRGEELNSVFEQAPNIIQSIADYLNVPIGKIREMASNGELTADVVKNAIFAATDDINAKFDQMPKTWNQIWTMMGNAATMQFEPVLMKINELANNQEFQIFATNAVNALSQVAIFVLDIFEMVGNIASVISDNWGMIAPIIMGIVFAMALYKTALFVTNAWIALTTFLQNLKAAADMRAAGATFVATMQQHGFNAALAACPLTWIIGLIILLVAVIYAVSAAIAKMTGIAETGFGVIAGGINVVIHFFKNLGLAVANIAVGIGNAIGALASNMMTAFSNAISSVQSWFYDLMSDALGVIESIAKALNKLPFVEFDYSGISAKADEYAAKSAKAADYKKDYESISDAFSKGYGTFDAFGDGWASDAFSSGASWGDGVMQSLSDKFSFGGDELAIPEIAGVPTSNLFNGDGYDGYGGYDTSKMPSNIADIAGNTASMKDSMDITSEDLKYLRDIAETEAINRFTTAEIKVEMTNNNSVSSDMDLDGIVDYLTVGVNNAMLKAAEGVHI